MSSPRYQWRQLSAAQRRDLLTWRKENKRPWHSPPHRPNFGHQDFLITASCFQHADYIGHSPLRMDDFSITRLGTLNRRAQKVTAWCLLPNHYHALVSTDNILNLLRELGRLHGRTSHQWNGE